MWEEIVEVREEVREVREKVVNDLVEEARRRL